MPCPIASGSRFVTIAGGLLLGLGMVLSSQATTLWHLHVTFGFCVGFAAGAFLTPLSATATKWFTSNRGLAVGIVSAGGGAGMLLLSPLTRWVTSAYDWRVAMIVLGDLAWLVVIPVALLIKNAPADMGAVALGGAATRQRDFSTREVLRAPQFWAIALTHFACCAAHAGPIFHMVTHAIDQGVAGDGRRDRARRVRALVDGRAHRVRDDRRPLRRQAHVARRPGAPGGHGVLVSLHARHARASTPPRCCSVSRTAA